MARLAYRKFRGKRRRSNFWNPKTAFAVLPGLLGIIRELLAIWRK
jgi:hypothetical protein